MGGFGYISSLNYAGGEALAALHELENQESASTVDTSKYAHIGVLAAMSGVTRFGEIGDQDSWQYSKNETIDLNGES
eukprot:SAG31_NODE_2092_length_6464_cov_3.597172_11_plen_77_part_00